MLSQVQEQPANHFSPTGKPLGAGTQRVLVFALKFLSRALRHYTRVIPACTVQVVSFGLALFDRQEF